MATALSVDQNGTARRVVLIDFDWQDADLLPELLARPGVLVRLVAGQHQEDPGLRLAELCGLPRTLDLADLTREIFDLALVSERSNRRTQIEGLLLALGTPCSTPQAFLSGAPAPETADPAIEAPLALHAAAFEHSLGGEDFDSLVEQALPDLSAEAPTQPKPVKPVGAPRITIPSLENFPSLEDRKGLEEALQFLVAHTGAASAELHSGVHDHVERIAQVGVDDPLLAGLVAIALELGTPQVVERLSEPNKGKAWGAWPFRTTTRRGVIAAAAVDPAQGLGAWQTMVDELRSRWDQHERVQAAPAFPMIPGVKPGGWLDLDDFGARLELALERNRRDRLRFELYRLEFPEAPDALERVFATLPAQLRGTDCLCRPAPRVALLLTAGGAEGFEPLRRRLMELWEQAWFESGSPGPAPAPGEARAAIEDPDHGQEFLARAAEWIAPA